VHPDEEYLKRLAAAGMVWDDEKQDWIPDPAVWGEPGEAP
jgi:hypothetical protein